MAAAYHRDIHFSDEVFTNLRGPQAAAMWRMLCDRAEDLKIEFSDIDADNRSGRAHWEAWYTFTTTGRKVHNVIEARFEFRDGRIVRHRDAFDFWRWSRQAIGPVGVLLGWTSFLKKRVRREAARNLDRFTQKSQALTP
jgi:SnoaL-like domain